MAESVAWLCGTYAAAQPQDIRGAPTAVALHGADGAWRHEKRENTPPVGHYVTPLLVRYEKNV